ncbi:hypothetical protein M2347_003913 [Chryseobacterium sp. H1D6B]|uniref:hypothetical protein n=1 Tax=Chryseobacterium sp. H1D6B TaxID=2940588 RepID=UPI0015C9DCD6|nr:hypothetical protein [Chryseobacterium sp. H1D6B]MDH6254186.1 hypothetical protein [Chryseobacterium sp. H1D6B]
MIKYFLVSIGFVSLFSCKEEHKKVLNLEYIKNNQSIYIQLKNNTDKDVLFLVPNSLEFGDKNYKSYSTRGSREDDYPINVYAVIESGQSSKIYQKKLDSIHDAYLTEIGNGGFIGDERPGDGHSVFYLKKMGKLKVKYQLTVKQSLPIYNYSSKFKQNYYPYDKILKGTFPEGEYLRRFSKLNFGKAKFIAQPVIEDSLYLNISQNDVTK